MGGKEFLAERGKVLTDTTENAKKAGFPVLLLGSGIGASVLFIYLFTEIAEGVLENEVKLFDDSIISFLRLIENPFLDKIMLLVTELGSVWLLTVLSILTILILWVRFKDKWGILFFIIGIGGGGLLTKLLKYYYERGRPSINPEIDAIGYSFPSGHSMGSLIFYGFIAYFLIRSSFNKSLKWTIAILAIVLAGMIGFTRIYLGAHFPSDVIAGHLAGAFWLVLSILSLEWVEWLNGSSVRPVKALRSFLAQGYRKIVR